MKVLHHVTVLSLSGLCVPAIILGGSSTPAVQPICVIAWDWSEDSGIDEYRVTVWIVSEVKPSEKLTHRVNPPPHGSLVRTSAPLRQEDGKPPFRHA